MSHKYSVRVVFFITLCLISTSVCGQNLNGLEEKLQKKFNEAILEKERKAKKNERSEAKSRQQSEAVREAEIRRAKEAEKERREMEFVADKDNLQKSLRGNESSGSSTSFSSGLRGISDNKNVNGNRAVLYNGLRGVSDGNSIPETFGIESELRGYSNESLPRANPVENTVKSTLIEDNSNNADLLSNPKSNTRSSGIVSSHSYEASFSATDDPEGTSSILSYNSSYLSIEQNHIATRNTSNQSVTPTLPNQDYIRFIQADKPEPKYYHGQNVGSYRIVASDIPQDSFLEKIEQRIDLWREEAKHEVITYMGDKLTRLARKTISGSSAIGTQIVKVYDIIRNISDVKNMEMNIITKTLDATSKSIKTEDASFVNETLQKDKKDADTYLFTYMEKNNYIPPSPQKITQKAKDVTKTAGEAWIYSRITR